MGRLSYLVLLILCLCEEFSKCMPNEFEMSRIGELNFFLRLQIKQLKDGIFMNQDKYTYDFSQKVQVE